MQNWFGIRALSWSKIKRNKYISGVTIYSCIQVEVGQDTFPNKAQSIYNNVFIVLLYQKSFQFTLLIPIAL